MLFRLNVYSSSGFYGMTWTMILMYEPQRYRQISPYTFSPEGIFPTVLRYLFCLWPCPLLQQHPQGEHWLVLTCFQPSFLQPPSFPASLFPPNIPDSFSYCLFYFIISMLHLRFLSSVLNFLRPLLSYFFPSSIPICTPILSPSTYIQPPVSLSLS